MTPRSVDSIYPKAERFWLFLSGAVILASMVLSTTTEVVSVLGFAIPTLCPFRWVTQVDCLGCGLTRSFVYMGHGDFSQAFQMHKLGPMLYMGVAGQVPWRVYRLWKHRHHSPDANHVL